MTQPALCLILVLMTLGFYSASALVCPSFENPYQCECSNLILNSIVCLGENITQDGINESIEGIRLLNDLANDDWLYLSIFRIAGTNLKEIDVAPLHRISAAFMFAIENNPLLEKIYDSSVMEGNQENLHGIDAIWLFITNSTLLNDEGFGETVRYFTSNIQMLVLNSLNLQGGYYNTSDGSGDIELLPGLGDLGGLSVLDLHENSISHISGGQFKRNSRLGSLSLEKNSLVEVGPDAFFIQDHNPPTELLADTRIQLGWNQLTELNFDSNNGLDSFSGKTLVFLNDNKMESLSEEKFTSFLNKNSSNFIELYGNNLYCDGTMKWLGDDPTNYAGRVSGAYCSETSPPQTIFSITYLNEHL